ncbi:2-oxoacid:ferredoxin oxidoreductase subunit beta [Marinicella gelatinilytica]|uniref:2-oxoacid:ferredoxin oxidoreductase subunit beta n=1 Tax=Marinicella gelatinilytica TaxID=2996017 RepID=UPI00226099A8|nr:2-oxoacid:ferredoxin oxidoreductase subunit beta [Marinicella gelatinilytica]MCX7546184.1 2-oxoacid:ferredoxin oxidoreductase subunit beta [Marinicella gelatinilytica]
MTYIRPNFRHPEKDRNKLGYSIRNYEGALSTLCAGCGHDSISAAIIQSCFDLNLEPHKIAKISGIGCSSKTPTYFLGKAHGFNSVHGRMPSVTTGANMANKDLLYLGVSGDGDTASIGMGQFAHVIRRNLNMVYIVMNNGCYGLTKGQDSATADKGSVSKKGVPSLFDSIDLCQMALQLGAGLVARSFSGDKKQLTPLIKAAIQHRGFAFIDVISPCVTFNNTPQSTKGYEWVREHMEATGTIDFIPDRSEITLDYPAGSSRKVTLHDGSELHLQKNGTDYDLSSRKAAMNQIETVKEQQKILTGLIYHNETKLDTHGKINTVETPLNALTQDELCPGSTVLSELNAKLR